jgi:hypothetical protein
MATMRQEWWNPECSMTATFGDLMLGKYIYSEELAGPDGMHYHVWVPPGTSKTELAKIRREIASNQDLVSMSYDFEEPGMRDAVLVKGAKPATIETIQAIVEEKTMAKVRWHDGKSASIDLFTASAIAKVYEAINLKNQAKFREILAKGPGGLMKLAEISFTMLK